MDHLPAHGGEDVRAEWLVAGLLGRVQGEHEVLLGGGLETYVVAHPPGQLGQFGGAAEQPLRRGARLRLLQQVGDLVQLADDRLAPQPAAALGVPLAEHRGGGLQEFELGRRESRRAPRVVGEVLGGGLSGRCGHQPALHRLDERRPRGQCERAAEEAAPGEHQVAAGELAEQRDRLRAGPGHVDTGHRGRLVRRAQPQVLDGDHTAEPFGEELREDARDRLTRVLTVEPPPHSRGVGADVVGAHLPCPAVHLAGQFALRPAAAYEPGAEPLVRALPGTCFVAVATADHWNAPIPLKPHYANAYQIAAS